MSALRMTVARAGRAALSVCALALPLFPMSVTAAKVTFEHPLLSIDCQSQPLKQILEDLAKEMDLTARAPESLNPVLECDIRRQEIEPAFKTLLGDLSYSLVWAADGKTLTGLVIFSDDGQPSQLVGAPVQTSKNASSVDEATIAEPSNHPSAPTLSNDRALDHRQTNTASVTPSEIELQREEKRTQIEQERAEYEERRLAEYERRKAEQEEQLRQQDEVRRERTEEEAAKRVAEAEAKLKSMGVEVDLPR